MATTVRDVISGAFRLLAGDDQTFTAADYQNALYSLNSMLQTWTTDSLDVWTINRTVFPLVIGTQSYTLGTGGTLNMARPTWIENIAIMQTGVTPNVEIPIQIMQDQDWMNLPVKAVSSSFPTSCYPQGDYPLNTLNFWPIPATQCSVVLYTPGPFGGFATINDAFSMPNGYERAVRYNLAVELAPEFGSEAPPSVMGVATLAINQIRIRNYRPDYLRCDSALLERGGNADIFNRSYGFVAP